MIADIGALPYVTRHCMDEVMIRDAARALSRRFNDLLNESMAPEIRLSREEALLAQSFAESVADLLSAELSRR